LDLKTIDVYKFPLSAKFTYLWALLCEKRNCLLTVIYMLINMRIR